MENLSEEELKQLLTRGRIQANVRRKRSISVKPKPLPERKQPVETRKKNPVVAQPSEPDPEWLKAEIEKTKRNIAKPKLDNAEQRHEAAKF